jgi:hypothetical protein
LGTIRFRFGHLIFPQSGVPPESHRLSQLWRFFRLPSTRETQMLPLYAAGLPGFRVETTRTLSVAV